MREKESKIAYANDFLQAVDLLIIGRLACRIGEVRYPQRIPKRHRGNYQIETSYPQGKIKRH